MNFARFKKATIGCTNEYELVNVDKIVKIKKFNANYKICFENKNNDFLAEDCEHTRVILAWLVRDEPR